MKDLGGLKSYLTGFAGSLGLTLLAYFLVARHVHSHHRIYSYRFLITILIFLALVQFFIQLIFFLHLGRESKPKWNLITFYFMTGVVLIIVLGSLWIMSNLNYNNMTPQQTNNYIIKDEGFGGH